MLVVASWCSLMWVVGCGSLLLCSVLLSSGRCVSLFVVVYYLRRVVRCVLFVVCCSLCVVRCLLYVLVCGLSRWLLFAAVV